MNCEPFTVVDVPFPFSDIRMPSVARRSCSPIRTSIAGTMPRSWWWSSRDTGTGRC